LTELETTTQTNRLDCLLRDFLFRSHFYLQGLKNYETKILAELHSLPRHIFSRLSKGYIFFDKRLATRLIAHIEFYALGSSHTFFEKTQRFLVSTSWLRLLIFYRIIHWPWETRTNFASRIAKDVYYEQMLQKIRNLEHLHEIIKSMKDEILRTLKTSIPDNINEFRSVLETFNKEIIEMERYEGNSIVQDLNFNNIYEEIKQIPIFNGVVANTLNNNNSKINQHSITKYSPLFPLPDELNFYKNNQDNALIIKLSI
jgi:hypothetical protein